MNCEDFNKIIHELADYKPMQATIRDAGVSHVALCADCATKLVSARTLSNSLVVAAGAESEEAPIRVKENLLAAFRALQQKDVIEPQVLRFERATTWAVETSVAEISMRRRGRWLTASVAVGAVAAVILLAVTVPKWRQTAPDSPFASSDLRAGTTDPTRTPELIADKAAGSSDRNTTGPTAKPVPGKRRLLRNRRTEAGNLKGTYETVAQNAGEFTPLTYLAKSTAIDSGTIVRVELSRSALRSLGLPVHFEGTGQSVKADVVIGDDGVAQAIRLVQ
jgi:hypothetical protein